MFKATRESYGEILKEIGSDKNVFVLDADLSSSTKTEEFKKLYPERFLNMGIAEANMVTVAAGISSENKIVFASSFAIFLTGRTYDQIRQSIAYNKSNVKLVSTHGGFSPGEDGATHQMLEDISITRTIPNIDVYIPSDDATTKLLIKRAKEKDGPVYVRLSRMKTPLIYGDFNIEFEEEFKNKNSYTHGTGEDFVIFAMGETVHIALEAKEQLEKENINVRVCDIFSIKPVDQENILKNLKETKNAIVIENHSVYGGLFSTISEIASQNYPCKILSIGAKTFGKSGKAEDIFKLFGITKENLVKKIKENI